MQNMCVHAKHVYACAVVRRLRWPILFDDNLESIEIQNDCRLLSSPRWQRCELASEHSIHYIRAHT